MKYDYLIVGAGITGAVLAYELNKIGKKVIIVDRRSHIGGNCYTEIDDGIVIHKYGAHIFHTDQKWVWDYLNKFDLFIPYEHQVKAIYNNKLYDLPFNLNTYQQIYNRSGKEALVCLEQELLEYQNLIPNNLEDQALKSVGKSIYKTLIEGYTEKQWGKACKELAPEIIKRLPLRMEANNNYFNDKYQGIPVHGYTKIIENMLSGIDIKLNYLYTKDSEDIQATTIIYTGSIDEYFNFCLGELEYRSLKFEETRLPFYQYQKYPVINYTNKEVPYTRIIEHKHFNKVSTKHTIITKEFPIPYERGGDAYYPINNEHSNNLYNQYLDLANKTNIIFCGRLGSFKYLDIDDAIIEAFKVLEKLKRSI